MNHYLEPNGFLGTGASLLADLTLLAYLFLIIPAMVAGFVFARRKKHRPHHRNVMMGITLANWFFILFLMIFALTYDVTDNVADQPGNSRYLFPVIHAALGLTAQGLATYVIYRMLKEDRQVAQAKQRGEKDTSKYWFTSAKPFMRATLTLWTVTSVLGVASYLIRYEVIDTIRLDDADTGPVATEEVIPHSTQEVDDVSTPEMTETPDPSTLGPMETATPEVDDLPAVTETPNPELTLEAAPEATPEFTPEVDDDDDDKEDDDDNSGHGSGEEDDDKARQDDD
ncbi:MAG: DUF420 domain-containing protein [Anaerolineales bacterium]|nr:DUF420 domain-containing protein [Anaerolineales bacterium]